MDKKITNFIHKHHVLSCSFFNSSTIHSVSCFYLFLENPARFIVASSEDTLHVELARSNSLVSGTIHLETKIISKIQGIQYRGTWNKATDKEKQAYLKRYPYAIALNPKLWCIDIEYLKFTDNALGFGKKLEFRNI